jgi:hypothetical protein
MTNDPTAHTLQTVLDRLPHAESLTAKARADLESAIHVFCRELGRQPGDTLVREVEQLGRGLNAARMGVTQGRLNNIRSMLRRAIAATMAEPARQRLDFPLAPIWEELACLLKSREDHTAAGKRQVYGDHIVLRRLFRIFQLQGVEPAAVTASAFDRVLGYLHETGASRPDAIYRKMVIAWNRLNALLRSSPI